MSPLALIPDAEVLVGGWLREHEEIQDLDARVAPRTPTSMSAPWVRVSQHDSPDVGHGLEHLIEYMLQLDCYAGNDAMVAHSGQATASLLGRTVRKVLKDLEGTTADGVAISRVRVRLRRLPDEMTEPAHERVIVYADVRMHAVPA